MPQYPAETHNVISYGSDMELLDLEAEQNHPAPVCATSQAKSFINSHLMEALCATPVAIQQVVQNVALTAEEAWCWMQCLPDPAGVSIRTLRALASLLAKSFGRATVRIGLGAERKAESMAQLRHAFVLVHHPAGHDIIVDPCFRDQFTLSRNDDSYEAFLSAIPQLFVGTVGMMSTRVQLCSEAMGQALAQAGMQRAPWRTLPALLSKWLPRHYQDEHFQQQDAAPASPGLTSAPSSQPQPQLTQPSAAALLALKPVAATVHSTRRWAAPIASVSSPAHQQAPPPSQHRANPERHICGGADAAVPAPAAEAGQSSIWRPGGVEPQRVVRGFAVLSGPCPSPCAQKRRSSIELHPSCADTLLAEAMLDAAAAAEQQLAGPSAQGMVLCEARQHNLEDDSAGCQSQPTAAQPRTPTQPAPQAAAAQPQGSAQVREWRASGSGAVSLAPAAGTAPGAGPQAGQVGTGKRSRVAGCFSLHRSSSAVLCSEVGPQQARQGCGPEAMRQAVLALHCAAPEQRSLLGSSRSRRAVAAAVPKHPPSSKGQQQGVQAGQCEEESLLGEELCELQPAAAVAAQQLGEAAANSMAGAGGADKAGLARWRLTGRGRHRLLPAYHSALDLPSLHAAAVAAAAAAPAPAAADLAEGNAAAPAHGSRDMDRQCQNHHSRAHAGKGSKGRAVAETGHQQPHCSGPLPPASPPPASVSKQAAMASCRFHRAASTAASPSNTLPVMPRPNALSEDSTQHGAPRTATPGPPGPLAPPASALTALCCLATPTNSCASTGTSLHGLSPFASTTATLRAGVSVMGSSFITDSSIAMQALGPAMPGAAPPSGTLPTIFSPPPCQRLLALSSPQPQVMPPMPPATHPPLLGPAPLHLSFLPTHAQLPASYQVTAGPQDSQCTPHSKPALAVVTGGGAAAAVKAVAKAAGAALAGARESLLDRLLPPMRTVKLGRRQGLGFLAPSTSRTGGRESRGGEAAGPVSGPAGVRVREVSEGPPRLGW